MFNMAYINSSTTTLETIMIVFLFIILVLFIICGLMTSSSSPQTKDWFLCPLTSRVHCKTLEDRVTLGFTKFAHAVEMERVKQDRKNLRRELKRTCAKVISDQRH